MYSIGQVAEMFGMPISTLRYYDKQGLFPNMERVSGIRKFSETEIEALRVIECLKKAGIYRTVHGREQSQLWTAFCLYPGTKCAAETRANHPCGMKNFTRDPRSSRSRA